VKNNKRRRSVTVVGLVGYNLGDEAIALAVLKRLQCYASVKVVSFQKNAINKYGYDELYFSPRSLKAWVRLLWSIAVSDVVVVGGGSLVQDKLGGSFCSGTIGYLNIVTFVSALFQKFLVSLPIGVDDLASCHYSLAKSILVRFDHLFVRDERSRLNVLKYSDGMLDPVVVPDPVFDKHHEMYSKTAAGFSDMSFDFSDPYICVALAKENTLREGSLIVREIVESIEGWLSFGYKVVLLSMDSRGSDEIRIYENIMSLVLSKGLEVEGRLFIYTPSNVEGAVRCVRNASFMLAMRLHAMIIGYSYVSMFCLSRTTKTQAFCEEHGVRFVDIDSSGALPPAVLSNLVSCSFAELSNKVDSKLLCEKQEKLNSYFDFLVSLVEGGR